jgi:hypothetical protein
MLLPEVTTFLASALSMTSGTNIFYGIMPPLPDVCVALCEYPGLGTEVELSGAAVNIEYPGLQIRARGIAHDYDGPRLRINQIIAALATIQDSTLSGIRYGSVQPKGNPYVYERDDNFRVVISCNFHVMKNWSAT